LHREAKNVAPSPIGIVIRQRVIAPYEVIDCDLDDDSYGDEPVTADEPSEFPLDDEALADE